MGGQLLSQLRVNFDVWEIVLSFLTWVDLAILCIIRENECIWQHLSNSVMTRILWKNTTVIRECFRFEPFSQINLDYIKSRENSDYLLHLYYEITNIKYFNSVQETRNSIDRLLMPIVNYGANTVLEYALFNPVHDLVAVVLKDGPDKMVNVLRYGLNRSYSNIVYHYSIEGFARVNISWSPKGTFLYCQQYTRNCYQEIKIFQYLHSIDKMVRLDYLFPSFRPQVQTPHCWLSDTEFFVARSSIENVNLKLSVFKLSYSKSELEEKHFSIAHLEWEHSGILMAVAGTNYLYFVDRCYSSNHYKHHQLYCLTLENNTCIVTKQFQIPGYILDLYPDTVNKSLIVMYRKSNLYTFNHDYHKPVCVDYEITGTKCPFEAPWTTKSQSKNHFMVVLLTLECGNNTFTVTNWSTPAKLDNWYLEDIIPKSTMKDVATSIIQNPSIIAVTNEVVIFSSMNDWRINLILMKHHQLDLLWSEQEVFYTRHPTKPFFIRHKIKCNNGHLDIFVQPLSADQYKKQYIRMPKCCKRLKLK